MRIPVPSSRSRFRIHLPAFPLIWSLACPFIALYIRNIDVFASSYSVKDVLLYSTVSFFTCALSFIFFKTYESLDQFFSVTEVLSTAKAVITAIFLTCIVMFSLTRLEGIARSVPIVHAMALIVGLTLGRSLSGTVRGRYLSSPRNDACENIILIGSNQLSALYIKMIEAYAPRAHRVMAILDDTLQTIGRTIQGVRVVGTVQHLESIIEEFAIHGVKTDRVIVAVKASLLPIDVKKHVQHVCDRLKIKVDFLLEILDLTEPTEESIQPTAGMNFKNEHVRVSTFFRTKRIIDVCCALAVGILLLPLIVLTSILVCLDVGSPILFWQRRIGLNGQAFMLYKFRTMQPPYDWRGNAIPPHRRLSRLGKVLRDTSLDELPQLLNVLVGEMSLIGPRPLLPEDQPANFAVRLMVRPGITGWAQVNGAKLLTAQEKEPLDEWYVRNASFLLDLRIFIMTLKYALHGPNRATPSSSHPSISRVPVGLHPIARDTGLSPDVHSQQTTRAAPIAHRRSSNSGG